jgi:DNA-binding HxlR family transcriptional regulator
MYTISMAAIEPPARTFDALPEALEAIGDRWSLLIVNCLLAGARRFGDLQAEIEGISPNVLSGRLRRLTDFGIVTAEPYTERPPRFAYELTAAGHDLAGPLQLLAGWAARHHGGGEVPIHEACGTALEIGWYCPACREPVGPEAEDELGYA